MPSNSSPYDYTPSVPAAVVFAVLYTIAAAITTFQYFYHRCWFWLPFVIGSLMEATGYIARIVSAKNPEERNPFIIQFIMIFLAPALLAASCYMAMGRVVLHVTPVEYQTIKSLWVKARWMTPVFVTFDVIAFFIQVIGGVSATSDSISTQKRGYNIAKIGLVVQLFAFGFFIVISFRFHIFSKKFRDSWPDSRWVNFLWGINISAVLIFIRSVYRLVEFASGVDSYLQVHEWGSIVFEAVMILPVFIIFNIMHPANYLNNISWKQNKVVEVNHRRLHSDGTELMEQGSGTPRK